ncbi:MAG: hypothetical protein V7K25_12970 [Nostoc sp.]|uniref:hypothetical protein n=1 Tax=Nostoc sp. TaxID=1180 RepID=UPI002FFCEEFB
MKIYSVKVLFCQDQFSKFIYATKLIFYHLVRSRNPSVKAIASTLKAIAFFP